MEPLHYKNKIIDFYSSKKRMPSYAEMMALFGFKSKNAVYKVIHRLIDIGIIKKDPSGKIIPGNGFNEIPMLGLVKAGFPTEIDELQDTVNIDNLLIEKRKSTYMLTVDGESMIDAHIQDGDWVLVEKTETAKDGQIVIAQIDGETTMKYFKQKGSVVWLEPANKNFKPLYPKQDLKIIGIVRSVIRKY